MSDPIRVCCFGGGGGLVQVVNGLIALGASPTALVGTADNGRSTGLVRRMFDIPAPGDLRSVLTALSANQVLRDLFEYRLETAAVPELTGTAFGNLFIGALARQSGQFEVAVQRSAEILQVRAPVLPLSTDNSQLAAELADGTVVIGEVEVRKPGKAPIERVFLDPPASATPKALQAIADADIVTIGPGSLFTSLIACLAVDGVVGAIKASKGICVSIANTTTQPGQSDDLSLYDQTIRLANVLNGALDVVVVNRSVPEKAAMARHLAAGRRLLRLKPGETALLASRGIRVVEADVAETSGAVRTLWQKEDALRHEPLRLAEALVGLARIGGQP